MVRCLRSWSLENDRVIAGRQSPSKQPPMHIFLPSSAARRVTFALLHGKRGWVQMWTVCSRAGKAELVSQNQLQSQNCRTCNATTAMKQNTKRVPNWILSHKDIKHLWALWGSRSGLLLAYTTASCSPSKAQSRQHQILRFLQQGSLIHVSSGNMVVIHPWALCSSFKHAKDQAAKPSCTRAEIQHIFTGTAFYTLHFSNTISYLIYRFSIFSHLRK